MVYLAIKWGFSMAMLVITRWYIIYIYMMESGTLKSASSTTAVVSS